MEKTRLKHYIVVICLLAAASWLVATQPPVLATDTAGVRMVLPDRVGEYLGRDMLYCQNRECLAAFPVTEEFDADACPFCGGELDFVSFPEKKSLPSDTTIVKKEYRSEKNPAISVSVVLSGKEQRSIHRPQRCLPAQGYTIEAGRTLDVPTGEGKNLTVMVLDTRGKIQMPEGNEQEVCASLAYWLVGPERETPYHLERLFWTSTDRVFRNVAHRWAYVALSTSRVDGSDEHLDRISEFVAELHPLIVTRNAETESPVEP
jgi:hypothetical protein